MKTGVMSHLRARLVAWLMLRGVVLLVVAGAGVALALGVADVVLGLAEASRALALWWVVAGGATVVIGTIVRLTRLGEWRLARQFEAKAPTLGNRLTNAVQLSMQTGTTPVTESLRLESVALGQQAARTLSSWPVSRTPVLRALGALVVIAAAWTVVFVMASDVVRAVWPRFADPTGDHPPFSRLRLAVQPGGAEVVYGGQLEVQTTASGAPVERLFIVARAEGQETRTPMFRAPDGTFFQTLANLRAPVEYFVTDGRARSLRFPVRIRYTPNIQKVELDLVFPSYTDLPARSVRLTDAEQNLPVGTRVNFRVFSNRPLAGGELTLTPVRGTNTQSVPLTNAASANAVTGAFELTEPVAFRISVRDVAGTPTREPRQGRFGIIADQRPRVFVLEPERRAVATPDYKIPVRVQADDDYAVSRVIWFRGLNKSIERPFSMRVEPARSARSVEATGALDLGALGVRPGDVIEYYFEAVDNDPHGPNVATSGIQTLEIISFEQYREILRRMARERQTLVPYDTLDNWLRRIAERARALEKKPVAAEATALADEIFKFREQAGVLLQQPLLLDIEEFLRGALMELTRRLVRLETDLAQMGHTGKFEPGELTYVAEELARLVAKEHIEIGEPFTQLLATARVVSKVNVFSQLVQQQTDLIHLLRRLENRNEPLTRVEQMELQQLAQVERQITKLLHDMAAELPGLVAQLPAGADFEQVRKEISALLEAIKQLRIPDDLSEATERLAQSDADPGIAAARRALESMRKLAGNCDGIGELARAALGRQPTLGAHMGRSFEQLLAALSGQGADGTGDGYSMFNQSVALYGPTTPPPAGRAPAGSGAETGAAGDSRRVKVENPESAGPDAGLPGRVRLQRDARFPLLYRDIVGEYFKTIAEEP